ncbi:hypothetical protein [Asanoa siamensis]|uniref:hypothetical protein n=1 Tax=Asanoa siamensis TaxID=926357 RepID=UPI001944E01E|nr:hypothetical protein [Asanoa siamensis]
MALLVVVAVAVFGGTAAARADPRHPHFATQASAAGLTGAEARALQHRVDRYLARLGGTQVGINRIDLAGGATLRLVVPGRGPAAPEVSPSGVIGPAPCRPHHFCVYAHEDYAGDRLDLYQCGVLHYLLFAGYGSYRNNQAPGTVPRYYSHDRLLSYSGIPGRVAARKQSWTFIEWVRPCG